MDSGSCDFPDELARLEKELAALSSRERDLTDFLENASIGLHWVDANGIIVWANRSELELLGYDRDEYVGRHISEFHADAPVIADILRRLSAKETLRNYEARLRSRSGAILHVQISSNVRWENGDFVHTRCFTRDVTDRVRYEQRLLTQHGVGRILSGAASLEDAARALLEFIGAHLGWCAGFLWIADRGSLRCAAGWAHDALRIGRFQNASRETTLAAGIGLPGRVLQEGASCWIADLGRDDNFPRLRAATDAGLCSGFGFPITVRGGIRGVIEFFSEEVRRPDEEILRMADALGYQIGEFVERIRAQQDLAEREESYRALCETASDGIITMDAGGAILFANSAAAKLFGYTPEELAGTDLAMLMPEHLRSVHKEHLDQYLSTGRRHLSSWQAVPLTGQHRHGHEIPLEVSLGEYRQGSKHLFVGVLRDVTERRRLEASVRQAAKLESLGVLAGGIAHDFNNLLTGILGNITLTMDALSGDDPLRESLQNAVEAGERAASLTKQMLAYAGKGRLAVEPVDVSALVRQISALVKMSIAKHVTLRLDLASSLPVVEADLVQLEQLVMNLVINGAEAIPQDRVGRLLVTTRLQQVETDLSDQFGAGDIQPGPYIVINVSDNGEGIDDATMGRIFDPFFTTKFTGRGLGLAAVLGIVRGHKGALRVFSIPGEGTTFRVFLPPSRAVREEPAQPVPQAPEIACSGLILVIDDEPIILKIATLSLKRRGYSVVTAENGRVGVERFRELHESLSLVILDMTMPIMNGEQALGHITAIDPKVPVVLSSGYNEAEAIEHFRGKGLAGFLQKPYTASRLTARVQELARPSG